MERRLLGFGIALLLAATPAAAAERWLHVHVADHGESGDTVNVNVPLSTVASLLPLVQSEELQGGKLRLSDDDEGVDLRAMWKALRSTGDTDFLTVDGTRGKVRISRSGPLPPGHRGRAAGPPGRREGARPRGGSWTRSSPRARTRWISWPR
jgi:hypothetical protein